ncbi:gp115 [Bacillus phage G]|uniref:Gp115 n=1 Tax=Bacillus phage G TaxID=2884420 RepID=G3MBH7_9CAUD|nr:gp115 [Bacillus phage G]AEO93377.1 gp115 [Bacillus phage G]
MGITLYKMRKMIEDHEYVEEMIDMSDWYLGKVYLRLKCNDKYIADILSGNNELDEYIKQVSLLVPYNCTIEYDIET